LHLVGDLFETEINSLSPTKAQPSLRGCSRNSKPHNTVACNSVEMHTNRTKSVKDRTEVHLHLSVKCGFHWANVHRKIKILKGISWGYKMTNCSQTRSASKYGQHGYKLCKVLFSRNSPLLDNILLTNNATSSTKNVPHTTSRTDGRSLCKRRSCLFVGNA